MDELSSGEAPLPGLCEAADLLAKGSLTAVQLAEATLYRAERWDEALRAFVRIDPERAMRDAVTADERRSNGAWSSPLVGIPVGLKDNITAEGGPTTNGLAMPVPELGQSKVDRRLMQAGAVVIGKLALAEGAYTEHRSDLLAPVNPWGSELWTGTSSSGNGVALASGMCFGAIGTDTGASLRFPAACTGTTSLRPTYGAVDSTGIHALAPSLDQAGLMARSVEDLGVLFDGVVDQPERWPDIDPSAYGQPMRLRVGLDPSWLGDALEPQVNHVLESVSALLDDLGCDVVRRPLMPESAMKAVEDWYSVCAFEAHAVHVTSHVGRGLVGGDSDLGRLLAAGAEVDEPHYRRALLRRARFADEVDAVFGDVDVLLAPVLPSGIPTSERMRSIGPAELDELHRFTCVVPMARIPSLTIPADYASPPTAVQLLGRRGSDRVLLRLGTIIQRHTRWHRRIPPLAKGWEQ